MVLPYASLRLESCIIEAMRLLIITQVRLFLLQPYSQEQVHLAEQFGGDKVGFIQAFGDDETASATYGWFYWSMDEHIPGPFFCIRTSFTVKCGNWNAFQCAYTAYYNAVFPIVLKIVVELTCEEYYFEEHCVIAVCAVPWWGSHSEQLHLADIYV